MNNDNSISKSFLSQKAKSLDDQADLCDISELDMEIGLISDPNIKKFVRYLLKRAHPFWKAPASLQSGIHPPDEETEGGLLSHTKRVVRAVILLSSSLEFENQNEFDCLLAAAILHDVTRFLLVEGEETEFLYDPMHAYTVDRFVDWSRQECLDQGSSDEDNTLDIDISFVGLILRLIRCSHGYWSAIPETIPVTELEKVLHYADSIAANLHIITDGPETKLERWIF